MSVGGRYFAVRSTLKRIEYKLVTAHVYLFFLRIMTSCDPGLRVKAIDTHEKTTSVSYLVFMFLAFLFNGIFCFSFCCLFVCSVLLKNAQIAVERCNLQTHTKRITIWFSTDDWSRKMFHNLIQSAWYRRDMCHGVLLSLRIFLVMVLLLLYIRETLGDAYKMWHPLLRWRPESTHWSGFIHAPTKRKRDKRGLQTFSSCCFVMDSICSSAVLRACSSSDFSFFNVPNSATKDETFKMKTVARLVKIMTGRSPTRPVFLM